MSEHPLAARGLLALPWLAVVQVLVAAAAVIGLLGALVESAGPDATAAPVTMAASECALTAMGASYSFARRNVDAEGCGLVTHLRLQLLENSAEPS